jgi:hypothetical protein
MQLKRTTCVMVLATCWIMTTAKSQESTLVAGPDLSGIWLLESGGAEFGAAAEKLLTAWGAERFSAHRATIGATAVLDANDPTLECLPPGFPYLLMIPTPFELVSAPNQWLQIFEYDHSLRRVHLDGREFPSDLHENGLFQWAGYSIGRIEGDALVIETTGFNDVGWIDRYGHPRSERLTVRERWERADAGTLVVDVTIDDPIAYREPWKSRLEFELQPDWEILEHVCLLPAQTSDSYREFRERAWQPSD